MPQPDLLHPVPDRRHEVSGLAFGDAVHHRVVGIAFEPDARILPDHPHIECYAGVDSAIRAEMA